MLLHNGPACCTMTASGATPKHHHHLTTMNRTLRTTIHVARTDWAPYIEAAVRAIATAAAFVYTAGYMTGRWLHNLNDRLALWVAERHYDAADAAAGALALQQFRDSGEAAIPLEQALVQRQAAVPHRAAIAAPRVHPAVILAASGLSQRAIAAQLGCTRYEVRKALKAA